jgi:hypothetical protein
MAIDNARLAPGSSLVGCCPGLQELWLQDMLCSQELLSALPGLSQLTVLWLGYVAGVNDNPEVLEPLCQLTGLRDLVLDDSSDAQSLLVLAKLKQLTQLCYVHCPATDYFFSPNYHPKVST